MPRNTGGGLLVLLLAWWLVSLRMEPPAVVPASRAGPLELSAERALAHVAFLDPEQTPHPVGSPAHAQVLERLVQRLRALGLSPEVQRSWSCRPGAACAPVANVLSIIPGQTEGPAVMMVAHYDSVHAGPGAGDDLHGVGVLLEVARLVLAGPKPRNPVYLLVTDAEEQGLLGARAFVRDEARAKQIAVAVNLEARGTSGRSTMFETSPGNARLIEALAQAPSPTATSLGYEVYKRLPNDTDLTELKHANIGGLNFAFVGDVGQYHTPLDSLKQLDPRSVQHQGDSAWAAMRQLMNEDLVAVRAAGDAVFFDVLSLVLLRAPAVAVVPFAVLLLGLVLVALALAMKRGLLSVKGAALGLLGAIGHVVVCLVAVVGVEWLVARGSADLNPWPAQPLPLRAAFVLAVALASEVWVRWLARRLDAVALLAGVLSWWALLGLASAVVAVGAAPYLLVPTMAGVLSLLWVVWRGALTPWPVAVTAVLWLPLFVGLELTLGFSPAVPLMVPFIVVLSALVPERLATVREARQKRWPLLVALATLGGLVLLATLRSPYDELHPRRMIVEHHTHADGGAELRVGPGGGPLPEALAASASFSPAPTARMSTGGWGYSAPAPAMVAEPPRLEVLEDAKTATGRVAKVRLSSPRGADRLVLTLEASSALRMLVVQGQPLQPNDAPPRWQGWRGVLIFGVPPEGVEVELHGEGPMQVELTDISGALSPEAASLAARRPPWATTSQWGDVTSIAVRHTLMAADLPSEQ